MTTVERLPESALNLYIRLYCRNKSSVIEKRHIVLAEATKSWLSLSESEKEIFTSKYNKILAGHKKKIADSLQNVHPYLKKKDYQISKKDYTSLSKHSDVTYQDETHLHSNNTENLSEDCKSVINEEVLTTLNIDSTQQLGTDANNQSVIQSYITNRLPEPIPPRLKSSKELFEILSAKTNNSRMWESLSTSEKKRYQNAVLSIKKQYLKSYRLFLDNLSLEELHDYYIKIKSE
ncbi:uncharacterized protein [Battus philenor]|uniref:uncharacterized protein n=1 Tax=Battus philenor TaxID=42288 RepID=UPI0035CEC100